MFHISDPHALLFSSFLHPLLRSCVSSHCDLPNLLSPSVFSLPSSQSCIHTLRAAHTHTRSCEIFRWYLYLMLNGWSERRHPVLSPVLAVGRQGDHISVWFENLEFWMQLEVVRRNTVVSSIERTLSLEALEQLSLAGWGPGQTPICIFFFSGALLSLFNKARGECDANNNLPFRWHGKSHEICQPTLQLPTWCAEVDSHF